MPSPVELTNQALRRMGLEVRRKPPVLVRSPHQLTVTLDLLSAHYLSRHPGRPLSIVQVGAFDGQANDPIIGLLNTIPSTGVLVEPHPVHFRALEERHRGREGVQVFNVAISDENDRRPLYVLKPVPGMPDWARQISSFHRQHLIDQQKFMPGVEVTDNIEAIEVETWTAAHLLEAGGAERIDLLQIDTEGYDLEVLRLFDIPSRRPAIIGYEHQHLSRRDRAAAADLLVASGYRLAMSYESGDTVAYLS